MGQGGYSMMGVESFKYELRGTNDIQRREPSGL